MRLEEKEIECRACGVAAKCLGRLVKIDGVFDLPDPGCLYHCHKCGLYFRYPYLSPSDLKALYSNLEVGFWAGDDDRQDFKIARDAITERVDAGKVLDIGCFRGEFLVSLGERYEKYGVELSSGAAKLAVQKGIAFVASDIDALKFVPDKYDVITMIDVIEHLVDPMTSLQEVWDKLNSGGLLLIATGNTNALPWRLLRLDYWYYWPDHVCFFNPRWFRWAARKLGGSVQSVKKFSHFEGSFEQRFTQLRNAFMYSVANGERHYGIVNNWFSQLTPFIRAKGAREAPKSYQWRDHMLLVLKKDKA